MATVLLNYLCMSTTTKRYLISFCFYFIASFAGVMLMQVENLLQTGNFTQATITAAIVSSFTTTV